MEGVRSLGAYQSEEGSAVREFEGLRVGCGDHVGEREGEEDNEELPEEEDGNRNCVDSSHAQLEPEECISVSDVHSECLS
eukprot:2141649-Rhodomonas_salina.1